MEKSDGSMYWPERFHDGAVSGDFDFVTGFLKKHMLGKGNFHRKIGQVLGRIHKLLGQ